MILLITQFFYLNYSQPWLSYTLPLKEYAVYLNDIPRYSLGIVFLWFGIDKFVITDFYLSWFASTERVRTLLPTEDLSISIYGIGVIELIFAALLFIGVKIRWVALAAVFFIIVILITAQYPSSFPQDIGLVGIALVLVLTNVTWGRAKTEKFLSFLRIMRYSIVAVLLLWAADHIVNIDRHLGWLQLASPLAGSLSADEIKFLLVTVFITEIVLGAMLASGRHLITKYSLIAVTFFFVFALVALAPPTNNHQTIGLALSTGWLAYIACSKNKV